MSDSSDPLTSGVDPPRAPPAAQAQADVDPNLENQVKALQDLAAGEANARPRGEQVLWVRPDPGNWNEDVFDFDGMSGPFDRSASNQAFTRAIQDPASPGTSGDGVVATLQVDLLACMERSFRSRHTMRRPRAAFHAAARKFGHGNDKGPLVQCQLEYVRGLVKESKDNGGGA